MELPFSSWRFFLTPSPIPHLNKGESPQGSNLAGRPNIPICNIHEKLLVYVKLIVGGKNRKKKGRMVVMVMVMVDGGSSHERSRKKEEGKGKI